MSKAVRLLLVLASAGPAAAPALAAQDAVPPRPPVIRVWEAAGIAAAVAIAASFDGTVRTTAQENRSAGSNDLARLGNANGNLVYAGPALAAVWLTGRAIHDPAVSRAAYRAVEAGIVAGGLSAVVKEVVGRVRPKNGGDPGLFRPFSGNTGFPSGHTTFAMAVASSLAHSTKDHWSDVLFYSAAGLTGFARINDDKHWLSDVLAGAALGYLTGRQINGRLGRLRPLAMRDGVGFSAAF